MTPEQAVEHIRGMSYLPNFAMSAMVADNYYGCVRLRIAYHVPNSNVEHAPNYRTMVTPASEFMLMVTDCVSCTDLAGKVLYCLMDIHLHEAREFLAVQGDQYVKPFHPHTCEGITNYMSLPNIKPATDFNVLNPLVFD